MRLHFFRRRPIAHSVDDLVTESFAKFAIEGKERLIPIITIYDVFWKHAYTQLYYALYDKARFIAVGTPSGTSLSRESGTHQSIQTSAVFMGLPNIIYYEPAFAIDTQVIYRWAIDHIMSEQGESVYLRLTTQDIDQPDIGDTAEFRENVIRGGYWYLDLRNETGYQPGRNAVSVFAPTLCRSSTSDFGFGD